jgi:hypothetical protein
MTTDYGYSYSPPTITPRVVTCPPITGFPTLEDAEASAIRVAELYLLGRSRRYPYRRNFDMWRKSERYPAWEIVGRLSVTRQGVTRTSP